jgi:hypothetical protein
MDYLTYVKQYIENLKNHDWYYNFSDDHQAWMSGSQSETKLKAAQPMVDPNFEIWNTISPDQFKDGK